MADDKPIACSLDAGGLERRLAAIAEIGADVLLSRTSDGEGGHLLRFRPGAETRRRLEEVAAAEAECCPFLDLRLREEAGAVVLSIAASEDGREVADALAGAFGGAGARGMRG